MKNLILPAVLLVVLFIFSSMVLNISESLPEGTVVPEEVKEILAAEKVDKAIIYSNFGLAGIFLIIFSDLRSCSRF